MAIGRNSIVILGLVAAFIAGSLVTGTITFADDDDDDEQPFAQFIALLTDPIFGLEAIKNDVADLDADVADLEQGAVTFENLYLFFKEILTTVDSGGLLGAFTSITIGTDGLPVISYIDFTNTNLKVAHCNDTACTSAGTTTVDSVGRGGAIS